MSGTVTARLPWLPSESDRQGLLVWTSAIGSPGLRVRFGHEGTLSTNITTVYSGFGFSTPVVVQPVWLTTMILPLEYMYLYQDPNRAHTVTVMGWRARAGEEAF